LRSARTEARHKWLTEGTPTRTFPTTGVGGCGRAARKFALISLATACTARAGLARADAHSEPRELLAPEFALPAVWTGDLDGIVERRILRVLTSFSTTTYFLDGLTQRGIAYKMPKAFEEFLNEELQASEALPIRVQIIPVDRDTLLPALAEGHADIAAANLTVTPERLESVDFSEPFFTKAREIVATGPDAPKLSDIDSLAGQTLHLRPSSSYRESVETLNAQLEQRQLPQISLVPADPHLEEEALLEMVAARALPWLVVDEHKSLLWVGIIPGLVLRSDLVLRDRGSIAVALCKNTPQLMAIVNRFVETAQVGSEYGNIVTKRYFAEASGSRTLLRPRISNASRSPRASSSATVRSTTSIG
jgi:membrane-bound lytic murein transglycosylase MltF